MKITDEQTNESTILFLLSAIRDLDSTVNINVLEDFDPEYAPTTKDREIAENINAVIEINLICALHALVTGDAFAEVVFLEQTRLFIKNNQKMDVKTYLSSMSFYINSRYKS